MPSRQKEMIVSHNILKLFKAMIINEQDKSSALNTSLIEYGVVLDFTPTLDQTRLIKAYYQKLKIRTLFSVEERENSDPFTLFVKQVLHYFEVYGLGSPGLFNIEFDGGTKVGMTYIKGVTKSELSEMVRNLIYSNAPVKDSEQIKRIIMDNNIDYCINSISNNELRVSLFDLTKDTFNNGDDAVRYMCYLATNSTLLIKSKQVEKAIKSCNMISNEFLERHSNVLSQVFNRHKRLIMSAKNDRTKSSINKISRWSKTRHIPVHESISKTYISKALSGQINSTVLEKISIRDKFKFLNLLDYKRKRNDTDAFIIRNGKIHIENGRKIWTDKEINDVETEVLTSLKKDLAHLKNKAILLDARVHYGLPVSRKQTVGHLPFGTRVVFQGDGKISSGIYWENDWGANDLDLSTIDFNGNRTGWGRYSGYSSNNSIVFSGDITNAPHGAMEFMTSEGVNYGLFVNIFNGKIGCQTEIVVGTKEDDNWISDLVIREKTELNSKGSVIGFVKDKDFIVFQGRMSNNYISGPRESCVVSRGSAEFWTVNRLFDALDIPYDVERVENRKYTNVMTYDGFTFEKIEELLLVK